MAFSFLEYLLSFYRYLYFCIMQMRKYIRAVGPVLIKTEILWFCPNQGSSTPDNLLRRVKTIWAWGMCQKRPFVPLQRVANRHIWFLTERDWSQECCHDNGKMGVILFRLWCTFSGAKFEEHRSNISRDIIDSVFCCFSGTIYDVITFICIIQNWTKGDIPKRKTPFFFIFKSRSNKQQLFFTSQAL